MDPLGRALNALFVGLRSASALSPGGGLGGEGFRASGGDLEP